MAVWMITGGSGFLGGHLLQRLVAADEPGMEVVAIGRRRPAGWSSDAFVPADLDDPTSLSGAVARVSPDVVLHLAARTSSADVAGCYRTNIGGTVTLVRALERLGKPCRLVTAGSAAELGPVPEDQLPIDDRTPCRPVGPYGLSKWFASAFSVSQVGPVSGVVARIFNPIGPGMPCGLAFGRFAARLAADEPDPLILRTGNLQARRDFIDVRDVASALIALAYRGRAGRIYQVGTGTSRRISEGLDRLIALSGRRVIVESSSGPIGPGPADSRASIDAIQQETGWSPQFPFETSLADLWNSVSG